MTAPTVHATCVAFKGDGILIRGPSASGKSDLALRLIGRGAVLVADDRTALTRTGGTLVAAPPEALAGFMEVRGLGLVEMEYSASCTVRMVIDLVGPEHVERMPEPLQETLEGVSLPLFRLDPFEVSAPEKTLAALDLATGKRRMKR